MTNQFFKPRGLQFSVLPPLSLYIHLRWCLLKCPYCDFNSHLAPDSKHRSVPISTLHVEKPEDSRVLSLDLQNEYLNAVIADLDAQLPKIWGRRLHTIFLGGGTPSLFEPALIDTLLGAVRARLGMPVTGEITLEANPGTFERERFKAYREAGVSRLSVGVQSFSDLHLQALGRIHSAEQAQEAVACATALFEEVNVDLMYGLPEQSKKEALQDVAIATRLGPTHLSLYQLTLEPGTLFAAKPPALPDDETLVQIEEAVHEAAAQAGYARYEISAFARKGHVCHHNLNYWGFGDYLGIGAGAHGKISYPDRIERETRHRNPQAYMQAVTLGKPSCEVRELAREELPFEFMLNALRLVEGVPDSWFVERCGRPLSDLQAPLKKAIEKGLLLPVPGSFKASPLGLRFLNDLQMIFLKDT